MTAPVLGHAPILADSGSMPQATVRAPGRGHRDAAISATARSRWTKGSCDLPRPGAAERAVPPARLIVKTPQRLHFNIQGAVACPAFGAVACPAFGAVACPAFGAVACPAFGAVAPARPTQRWFPSVRASRRPTRASQEHAQRPTCAPNGVRAPRRRLRPNVSVCSRLAPCPRRNRSDQSAGIGGRF